MEVRRGATPAVANISPLRRIYGRSNQNNQIWLPLDLVLRDSIGSQESLVLNRAAGIFNNAVVSGINGQVTPGYDWPPANPLSVTAALRVTTNFGLANMPSSFAPNPQVAQGDQVNLQKVVFTPNGWDVEDTGFTGHLVNNVPSDQIYLTPAHRSLAYVLDLDISLQPQHTGLRAIHSVTGALLGMLIVSKRDSNFALVYPASAMP